MSVPTEHLVILAGILFSIGVAGFCLRRNLIVMLMSVELMLNAANLTFLAGSRAHAAPGEPALEGAIFSIFVIVVAAVEASVGLALVIALYRRKQTVSIDSLDQLGDS
jgi:NADH-quinone oxidoreductase subunit K